MVDTLKRCTKCLRELALDRFALRTEKGKEGQRRGQCKDCRAAYYRKWRRDNPEQWKQIHQRAASDPAQRLLRKLYRANVKRPNPQRIPKPRHVEPPRFKRAAFAGYDPREALFTRDEWHGDD